MASLTAISTILTVATTALSAASTIAGGKAADAQAQSVAKQYERNAQQTRASAQRDAMEARRNSTLTQSTLQARAAASGGGADDPGVLDLQSDIAERGEYQSLMAMFNGENQARGFLDAAASARAEGTMAKRSSKLKAIGTIIGGASSVFGKFGNVGGTPMGMSGGGSPSLRSTIPVPTPAQRYD